MKNKIHAILLLIFTLSLINCNNDDNYKAKTSFQFPFLLNSEKQEVYYSNERNSFKLKPVLEEERDNVNISYTFSINTPNQNVSIFYDNEPIKIGSTYKYKDDKIDFIFKEIGQYEIKFLFENNYGYQVEKKEVFNITEIDFFLSLSYEDLVYPKIAKTFTLDIAPKEEEDQNADITYKFSYEYISTDNEKIDVVYNSKKLLNKEEVNYSTKELTLKFPTFGEYEINFTATSSQGKKVIKKEIITVSPVEFNFELTTDAKVYPNKKKLFKLITNNITEDLLQKYTFKFETSSAKEPLIVYNNTVINKNKEIPYSGEDLYITFPEVGNYDVKFTFENQYGTVVEKNFTYNVNYANFDVSIKNFPKEIYINKEYIFNVEPHLLEETSDNVEYMFKIKYDESTTKLTYDDSRLPSDTYIKYKGSKIKAQFNKEGNFDLLYSLKNDQGLEVSQKGFALVKVATFDLEVSKESSYRPQVKTPLKFKPINKSSLDDIDYEFNITSNDPNAKFFYNNVEISKELTHKYSSQNLEVIFSKDGTYEVVISMKNSHNQSVTNKTVIAVDPIKFNFDVENESKIYPTEKTKINLNIKTEGKEKQTFQFSYKVKGANRVSAYINQNLMSENSLVNYDITSNLEFLFSQVGVYDIEYTLINNFGYTLTKKITYDVNYANFEIDVVNNNKDIFINKRYGINVNPNSSDNKEVNYTYKISANPSVKAYYNGYQISLNNYANYSNPKIEFEFSEAGQQEVTIFMKNSQGKEVSKKILFDVKVATFTLQVDKASKYVPNKKETLKVKPINKTGLTDLTYEFSFSFSNDVKVYYKGSQIASGVKQKYDTDTFEIETTKSGDYELNIEFQNNHNQKVSQKTVIQVVPVVFNFMFDSENKEYYPNNKNIFVLKPQSEDETPQNYKFKIVSKGNARPNIFYNGSTIYENEYINYSAQNVEISFPQIGRYELDVAVQNQFGYTITKTFKFDVDYNKFDIDIKNIPTDIYVNNKFDVDFEPKGSTPNMTYDFKVMGTDGLSAYYNNYPIPLNNYTSYVSNKLGLLFNKVGQYEVTFFLRNSQGFEVSKKQIFNVKPIENKIDFSIPTDIYPSNENSIKVKFSNNSQIQGITYKYKLQFSDTNIVVKNQGSTIVSNYTYDYQSDDFKITFPKEGKYTINWEVENSLGGKNSKLLVVDVIDTNFSIRIEKPTQVFPNAFSDFNFKITEEKESTYQMKYSFTGGTGKLIEARQGGKYIYPDEWIVYNKQPYSFNFPEAGLYILNVEFKNKYNKVVTAKQEIKVEAPTFDVIITPNKNQVDQGQEVTFNLDVDKKPTNQEVRFTLKSPNKEAINYIKYNNRNVSLGEELIFESKNLVIGFKQPETVELNFEFKNNSNRRVVKNLDIQVNSVNYETTITSRVLDNSIAGYSSKFYLNPVKVSVNVNSKLNVEDLKIKISNPNLLYINNTIQPNTYFNLSSVNNQFTFEFDNAILGQVRNSVDIEVLDKYGTVVKSNLNVPINKKPDAPFISDFSNAIKYDKSGRNKGYTVHDIWIETFTIKTNLKLTRVVAKYDYTTSHYRRDTQASIVKVSNDLYEIRVQPNPKFYYYESNHNDDRGEITIIATDELGQESVRKIPHKID